MAALSNEIAPTQFKLLLEREIEGQFGRHKETSSCQTVKQLADAAIRPFAAQKALSPADMQRILGNMQSSLDGIVIPVRPDTRRQFLLRPAYASATDAVEAMRQRHLPQRASGPVPSQQLFSALSEAVTRRFGSHSQSPSYTTVMRVIKEACPDGGVVNADDILARIEHRLVQLNRNGKGAAGGWLEKAPFESAIEALRDVRREAAGERRESSFDPRAVAAEWESCLGDWTTGGRQRASGLNGRIFAQTLDDVAQGRHIDMRTHRRMLDETKYDPRPTEVPPHARRDHRTEFEFMNLSTYDAAERMLRDGYNPLVLDMANKKDVGGAPDRASAQEENCCRRSNLYQGLMKISGGRKEFSPHISPGGVYVPHVQVFRKGPEEGYAYHKPFACSVYASAAYNCNTRHGGGFDKPASERDYVEGTKQKMRDMFREAYRNGHDSLLLGAFGCGAFENDPKQVSQLYVEVLSEREFSGLFRKVSFGIIDMGGTQNLRTFERTFTDPRNRTLLIGGRCPIEEAEAAAPAAARHKDSCFKRVTDNCSVQ